MKEPPKDTPKQEPKKIKIVVKPTGGAVVRKVNIKEEPIKGVSQKPPKKKSILRRIGEIVSNDIHKIPAKLWGETKKQNGVTMPDSKESWDDWEGQI